jgi:hypothetical protein
MSTQSYSSIGAARRRGTAHDDIDRSFYAVGQTLASIVNDPRVGAQGSGFWGLGTEAAPPAPPPPLDPARYPPVSYADVARYLEQLHGGYERFVQDRQSLEAFDDHHSAAADGSSGAEGVCAGVCVCVGAVARDGTSWVMRHTLARLCTHLRCRRGAVRACADAAGSSSSSGGGLQRRRLEGAAQGEPFMVAMQAVPGHFFQQGFHEGW